MKIKSTFLGSILVGLFLVPSLSSACDAAGKSTHIGNLMTVNAEQNTFTIRDAQSRGPITFIANNEIIEGLKDASGSIMVNYEENGDTLTAVGVTF